MLVLLLQVLPYFQIHSAVRPGRTRLSADARGAIYFNQEDRLQLVPLLIPSADGAHTVARSCAMVHLVSFRKPFFHSPPRTDRVFWNFNIAQLVVPSVDAPLEGAAPGLRVGPAHFQ
jgi:hypothetical protein